MVVLDDEDLDHLPLATRKTVEIVGFVSESDVDPLLNDRAYFAGPAGEAPAPLRPPGGSPRPHRPLRSREVRCPHPRAPDRAAPAPRVLVVHALRWPQEIREPGDLASIAPVTERELELAEVLIEQLTGVDITDLHDEYGAALEQVVTANSKAWDGRSLPSRSSPSTWCRRWRPGSARPGAGSSSRRQARSPGIEPTTSPAGGDGPADVRRRLPAGYPTSCGER
jgi:DNA end-binding protein Ku